MRGRRGGIAVAVVGWLRVDCGLHVRGSWLRYPAADYACICGWTASASGDQVVGFVRDVRAGHAQQCTTRKGVPA